MYSINLYKSFVQIRKQLYKIKGSDQLNKYSNIEKHKKRLKTFYKFCLACDEYLYQKYKYGVCEQSIQEIFDEMLELSQKKVLKKYYIDN